MGIESTGHGGWVGCDNLGDRISDAGENKASSNRRPELCKFGDATASASLDAEGFVPDVANVLGLLGEARCLGLGDRSTEGTLVEE